MLFLNIPQDQTASSLQQQGYSIQQGYPSKEGFTSKNKHTLLNLKSFSQQMFLLHITHLPYSRSTYQVLTFLLSHSNRLWVEYCLNWLTTLNSIHSLMLLLYNHHQLKLLQILWFVIFQATTTWHCQLRWHSSVYSSGLGPLCFVLFQLLSLQ